MARSGVASRRRAGELIKAGKVTVNGIEGQLNTEVSDTDIVKVDGSTVTIQKLRYILLNKPPGYVTTLNDEKGRRKILDLLSISERVVPVGRLDYDTTGALLLTNDGELAHKLMHPSFNIDKRYEATVKGEITDEKLQRLERGVELEDGKSAPAKARKLSKNKLELIIHEGRKHQVKRMLAVGGLPVTKLHRSTYADLDLSILKPSQWRDLTADEIDRLKHL